MHKTFFWRFCYLLYIAAMKRELPVFVRVRARLLDRLLRRRHERLSVHPDVFINRPDRLRLGDNVSINRGCHLSCAGGLTIGSDVAIGHNSSILTADHGYDAGDVPIKTQPMRLKPTRIGDNVLIGCRVVILGGVEIAPGTAVAAGAVVTRTIAEPDTIVGGVPARRIKAREVCDGGSRHRSGARGPRAVSGRR